jgi:glycosidase
MQSTELQLLVKGKEIGSLTPAITYDGVRIKKVHAADSPNYLFIDLEISANAQAGKFEIRFNKGKKTKEQYTYELKERTRPESHFKGFDASDVIYLITPDRFANGDPGNDSVEGLLEQGTDRSAPFGRHGGDIAGIIEHLDYLQEMGFTAIWPSPLLENNMPQWSYHGYAITDYYQVDPRFGSNEDYIKLAEEARKRGMKLIFDGVANHCGSKHWWMEDLPFKDWINFQQSDSVVVTNHKRTVNQDAYAAEIDKARLSGGWFVPTMPDLNQRNPFMSNYLIQNNLWWIETLGLGGIRQDTYPYPYKDFLSDWTCRIMEEYPDFNIVAEEWSTNPLIVAYWQAGKENPDGYTSCLKSVMDFPIQEKLVQALNENDQEWGKGLNTLYDALANDFVYADPHNIMVFGDNHDMDRLITQLEGDHKKMAMALTYLLTIRGIPQIYYGTEVLIHNDGYPGDHGIIRTDFPGGWAGDRTSAVEEQNLSIEQAAIKDYLKKLLNWRKNQPAIHHGQTKHFAPQDATYTYFRYTDEAMVMVVLNKNEQASQIDPAHYAEMLKGHTSGINIMSGKPVNLQVPITVPAMSALVVEVK